VREAVARAANRGLFGYALAPPSLDEALMARLATAYGWEVQREWLVWLPGLVFALNLCCQIVGEAGDEVLTAVPIYPPFLSVPVHNDRKLVTVASRYEASQWSLRAEDIDAACTARTRLLLLCNPHNPVGRAYRHEELQAIAEVCRRRNLIVCSDEIHCDLILDPLPHHPLVMVAPDLARQTITLLAPSKTYNLAGLGCSVAVIPDPDLRQRFSRAYRRLDPILSGLAMVAAEAAYREGEPWRQALLTYLRRNRDQVARFVAERLPELGQSHVEATYLAWLDLRGLPTDDPAGLCTRHGLMLSDGRYFRGDGWMRLNFGCPAAILQDGLLRLEAAVASLR